MLSVQKFEVDCFLQLYDSCEKQLQNTLASLQENIKKEKWYNEWDWDIYKEEDGIHIYGYHVEDIMVIPGCPATYWEPADPVELDGYVEEDEVLSDLKFILTKIENVDDLEWLDINIDDEQKVLEGEYI